MATTNIQTAQRASLAQFIPVMLCFFAMGFVDLIGTAIKNVSDTLQLTKAEGGTLASLVFIWFFIFSVPTGVLMNKIGRKKTVLISLVVTAVSLIIPIFNAGYWCMVISFSLLGIGNAIMQTSLNPLVSNLIKGDKLASTLTFGQFVKAIASLLAPPIAILGATAAIPTFGLGWRVLFAIYGFVSIISFAALAATPIKEEKPDKASGFVSSLKQLGRPFILLCFLGIICHVGIDVGINFSAAFIIEEKLRLSSSDAQFGITIYFISRAVGSFLGSLLLQKVSSKGFFGFSVLLMIASMLLLYFAGSLTSLYVGLVMLGLGNSNIFPIIFAQALIHSPNEKNEVSGLMIMGLVGGAIFPPIIGFASDNIGLAGAIAVMLVGAAYLLFYTMKIRTAQN